MNNVDVMNSLPCEQTIGLLELSFWQIQEVEVTHQDASFANRDAIIIGSAIRMRLTMILRRPISLHVLKHV